MTPQRTHQENNTPNWFNDNMYVDEVYEAFNAGDCNHLAAGLNTMFHFPLWVYGNLQGNWSHMFVRHPRSGYFIDVNGAFTADEIREEWEPRSRQHGFTVMPYKEHIWTDRRFSHIPIEDGIVLTISNVRLQRRILL